MTPCCWSPIARIAGCPTLFICTPPRPDGTADPAVLTIANLCGVRRVFKIGGAQAVGAEKLVFLSDVNGVRRDKNDPSTLIHSLTAKEARRLIAERAIEAGMSPKVEACLETLQKGVRKIHLIDGRIRHSLMLEIYTNEGIGTEIVAS